MTVPPRRRRRALDAAVVVWIGCIVLATFVALSISDLTSLSDSVVAAMLLVALGSDYNVFMVGRIWQEARHRPLPEAIAVAVPRASHAITAVGIAFAASFALLGLVPVSPFRELALAMVAGVLLDAFVVRSLLVPGLVMLVGRTSGWPGRLAPSPAIRKPVD